MERRGDKEVLWERRALGARRRLVVGVEDLADILRSHLAVDGPVVVADVERLKIERLRSFGLPQAKEVRRRGAIAEDRSVVGDTFDYPIGNPPDVPAPARVDEALGATPEADVERDLRPGDLPGVSQSEPLVGHLHLPAVAYLLVEDAELVPDPVSDGRNRKRRQRVHEAGGEPAQTAVSEA